MKTKWESKTEPNRGTFQVMAYFEPGDPELLRRVTFFMGARSKSEAIRLLIREKAKEYEGR